MCTSFLKSLSLLKILSQTIFLWFQLPHTFNRKNLSEKNLKQILVYGTRGFYFYPKFFTTLLEEKLCVYPSSLKGDGICLGQSPKYDLKPFSAEGRSVLFWRERKVLLQYFFRRGKTCGYSNFNWIPTQERTSSCFPGELFWIVFMRAIDGISFFLENLSSKRRRMHLIEVLVVLVILFQESQLFHLKFTFLAKKYHLFVYTYIFLRPTPRNQQSTAALCWVIDT